MKNKHIIKGRKVKSSFSLLNLGEDHLQELFGPEDKNLRLIEKEMEVKIAARGGALKISGDLAAVRESENLILQLHKLVKRGHQLAGHDVKDAIRISAGDSMRDISATIFESLMLSTRSKPIVPRSAGQKEYLRAIHENDVVLSIGPAGTGKTYLACAVAVSYLLDKKVKRIILARPAVEAGEKLGFLPGDIIEKVNPYLRPLYDALYDMMDVGRVEELIANDVIEIAPLAFMRGRTLNDAFVIIDEAQNSTRQQMKMCLTRLGFYSKMIVTGDVTQIDLPQKSESGMLEAWEILKGIKGIAFHSFTETDIVRHPLVGSIVQAYDKNSVL